MQRNGGEESRQAWETQVAQGPAGRCQNRLSDYSRNGLTEARPHGQSRLRAIRGSSNTPCRCGDRTHRTWQADTRIMQRWIDSIAHPATAVRHGIVNIALNEATPGYIG